MQKVMFLFFGLAMLTLTLQAQSTQSPSPTNYTGYGVDALYDFDKLHYLRGGVLALQESSHDPTGLNLDGCCGNFRYVWNGENVMLDTKGPGVVYRIWVTGYNSSDRLKFYFDGETTPTIDMTISEFFSGTETEFPAPLSVNDNVSSGGFICYVPIPYEESLKITTTGDSYYNITFHKFDTDFELSEWTAGQDNEPVINQWNALGSDPKTGLTYTEQTVNRTINTNTTEELFTISTPNTMIGELRFTMPELTFLEPATPITDDGRAFTQYCEFDVAIDSGADSVSIVRRLDYGIADQKANVSVDGSAAGEWFTPGANQVDKWLDSEFKIPPALTQGKSSITVKVEFVSAAIDWNEFHYWVYSDGVMTDSLDVGDTADESAHNYVIMGENWSGTRTYTYPTTNPDRLKNQEILNNLWLSISFDGESEPSVYAPFGLFFGIGGLDAAKMTSLALGVDDNEEFYCYFPMPFQNEAKISLINNTIYSLTNVDATVKTAPLQDSFDKMGYFKAYYHSATPTPLNYDYRYLDIEGTGHYVGIVLECHDGGAGYLEGDERFYIDDARTPWIYGTGTEDYFNGGWYYNRGLFDLATHGLSSWRGENRVQYRFHYSDVIPFYKRGVFGIEHGGTNDHSSDYYSVAYYYIKSMQTAIPTDTLELGDSTSMANHSYTAHSSATTAGKTYYFEGDFDTSPVSSIGYYHQESSDFTLNIDPENEGVRLLRLFDYSEENQSADIYVDDSLVGTWYSAGSNEYKKWREEFFLIPKSLTNGKSQIDIHIDASNSPSLWSEFRYVGYVMKNVDAPVGVEDETGSLPADYKLLQNYPNPFNPSTTIEFSLPSSAPVNLSIYNILGERVAELLNSVKDAGNYKVVWNGQNSSGVQVPSGVYFYSLESESFRQTKKMLLLR